MQNQPSTFRFTLRALFICTAFVGLGLLAMKYPSLAVTPVQLAVVLLVAYAVIAALVHTGTSRLFWGAFAVAAVIWLVSRFYVPDEYVRFVWMMNHPEALALQPWERITQGTEKALIEVLHCLFAVLVSTVAAYIIPWLVQRGQKPSGD